MRTIIAGAFGAALAAFGVTGASADPTVECRSRNHQYDECWAGGLKKPQLIHQISSSSCILNKTWGFNPKSGYIWVGDGCAGVFADVAGYHHGRGGTVDANARAYDKHGHDTGAAVGAAVIGALVGGMIEDSKDKHHHHASNHHDSGGYNGCHGVGCLVDDPDDAIDDTPQFDARGEPNFDVDGNYQGCHGLGCLTDDPDDDASYGSDDDDE